MGGAPTDPHGIAFGPQDASSSRRYAVNEHTNPLGRVTRYTTRVVRTNRSEGVRGIIELEADATASTPARRERFTTWSDGILRYHYRERDDGSEARREMDGSRLGYVTDYNLDDGGALERRTDIDWDDALRKPTRIAEPHLYTDLTYDADGLPLTMTLTDRLAPTDASGALYAPTTRTWTFAYTPEKLLASIDGPLPGAGDVVSYAYDAQGFLASTTDARGHTTTVAAVNGRGQPLRVIGPDGVAVEFAYDFRGRPTQIVDDADGARRISTFAYDAVGQLVQAIDADGVTHGFVYDAAMRLVEMTDGRGGVVEFDHDAMGNVTATRLRGAIGAPVAWEQTALYDDVGRLRGLIGGAGQQRLWTRDMLAASSKTSTAAAPKPLAIPPTA